MAEKERWKEENEMQLVKKNGKTSTIVENGYNNEDDDSADQVEDQLEDVGIVRAPDGGYGWVVVFASFLANMIVDGIIFSISETIVPLWENEFKSTTSATTIATSLLAGCYLLSGPLGSSLANSFGCNWVAVAGAVIAASGFLLTVLAPALPVLYITFGIIGGIGYGLIFLPAVVIVSQYFSEKRALATGIAVCGSGIGTSLFSYLNPMILRWSNNNWRIFLVVLACVNLSCVCIGYFFKPLKPSKKQIEEATKITNEYIERHASTNTNEMKKGSAAFSNKLPSDNLRVNGGAPTRNEVETTTSPHVTQGVAIERFERDNVGRATGGETGGSALPASAASTIIGRHGQSTTASESRRTRRQLNTDRPFLSTIELHAGRKFEKAQEKSTSRADLAAEVTKASMADLNRPLSKMDIFYSGSVASLQKYPSVSNVMRRRTATAAGGTNALSEGGAQNGLTAGACSKSALYLSTAGLPSSFSDDDDLGGVTSWTRGIIASLRSILDVSLLRSPSFLILAFSGFLSMTCFFVPFMFIGALAKQNSVSQSLSKYLVMILGLVNLAARVICGLVSDHPKVDPLMVSNVALIAGGIATSLAPLCTEFWMFAVYCVPFAFGVACFAALRSVICVELLGIERLTNAYGMLMLFMGVAALIGPPFAALLKNLTNSFYMSFHVMGAIMALSGLVSVPLRKVARWEAARNAKLIDMETGKHDELEPLNPAKIIDDLGKSHSNYK